MPRRNSLVLFVCLFNYALIGHLLDGLFCHGLPNKVALARRNTFPQSYRLLALTSDPNIYKDTVFSFPSYPV